MTVPQGIIDLVQKDLKSENVKLSNKQIEDYLESLMVESENDFYALDLDEVFAELAALANNPSPQLKGDVAQVQTQNIDRSGKQNLLPGGGQEVEAVESASIAPMVPKSGKNRLRFGENAKAAMSSAFGVQDRAVVDMISDAESRADQLVSQAREGAVEQLAQQMANAKLQAIAGFGEAFTQAFSIDNLLDGVLEAELVE